jgi:hypothetical protein
MSFQRSFSSRSKILLILCLAVESVCLYAEGRRLPAGDGTYASTRAIPKGGLSRRNSGRRLEFGKYTNEFSEADIAIVMLTLH